MPVLRSSRPKRDYSVPAASTPAPQAQVSSHGSKKRPSAPAAKPKYKLGERKPLYTTKSRDLFAFWNNKWYPIRVVREPTTRARGQWLYEILWKNYDNVAPPGEPPTNESTYPEDWIARKAETETDLARATAGEESKADSAPATDDSASSATTAPFKWQYRLVGDVWGDYNPAASEKVEEAFQSWVSNPYIDVRSVRSGMWEYMVDFNRMEQVNIAHSAHTARDIRRVRSSDGAIVNAGPQSTPAAAGSSTQS